MPHFDAAMLRNEQQRASDTVREALHGERATGPCPPEAGAVDAFGARRLGGEFRRRLLHLATGATRSACEIVNVL